MVFSYQCYCISETIWLARKMLQRKSNPKKALLRLQSFYDPIYLWNSRISGNLRRPRLAERLCFLVLQEAVPALLGSQVRKDCSLTTHGPRKGKAIPLSSAPLTPTLQHRVPVLCCGLCCGSDVWQGRKWGRRNCYSAVLVSMTRAFITCAPWGKRHNLDSTADNSAVLCLWDEGKLLLL